MLNKIPGAKVLVFADDIALITDSRHALGLAIRTIGKWC